MNSQTTKQGHAGFVAKWRRWNLRMASCVLLGALGVTVTGASAAAQDPASAATLSPVHADTGALSVDQGKNLTLEVVKRQDGLGLQGQNVDWVVSGPGKASLTHEHTKTLAPGKDTQAGTARTVFHASVPGNYVVTATTQKNPGCSTANCASWVSTRFAVNVVVPTGNDAAGGSDSDDHRGKTIATAAAILAGGVAIAAGMSGGNDHNVQTLPSSLQKLAGDGQFAAANAPLLTPLSVRAISGGAPVPGIAIQWAATGGATLSGSTSVTDGNGMAVINVTSVGPGPGSVTITATRADDAAASVSFTAGVYMPTLSIVSGNNQTGFPNQNAALPLVVQASVGPTGQSHIPITWAVVSGNATVASVSNGGFTDINGMSNAVIHFGATTGPVQVTATRTDNGASQTFSLTSAIVNTLAILNGNNQTACPALPLPQALSVLAQTNNQNAPGVTINWTASAGSTLSSTTSVTNSAGVANVNMTNVGAIYQATPTTVSVNATRADDPTATVAFIENVPASTLAIASGNSQSGAVGSTSSPFVVSLVDGCGHAIPNQPVSWTLVSGNATLSAPTTNSNAGGQASVTVTYGTTPGPIVIQASAFGGGATVSFNATSTTGGLAILSGNGQTGAQNANLPVPLTVQVTPAIAGVPVSFTVTSGTATIATPSVLTNSSGQASTTVQLGWTPGAVTIVAQSGTASATFSETITGTLVNGGMTIVSGNNQVIAPGTASQPLVIQLTGNSSPLAGMTIAWSTSNGTVSASSTVTGANGQTSVTVTPSSNGPLTVTASFAGYQANTPAQVTFAENTTLASGTGVSTNDASIVHALNDACASLQAVSNRSPQQQDLLNQCLALAQSSSVSQGSVAGAVHVMAPAVAQTQTQTAVNAANTQFTNLTGRMAALRGGAHGMSFAGLAFGNDTGSLSLGDVGSALLGASDQKKDDDAGFSRWGFFASGQIQHQSASGFGATPGYGFNSNGVTFGSDYRVNDGLVLGGALGYTRQSTTLDLGQGGMTMHGWSLSGYGTWYNKSDWYIDGSLTWSNNSFDAHRNIVYVLPLPGGGSSTVNQTAQSSSGGNDFAGSLTFGRDFHQKALAYGFYGKLQYDHASFDGFQETTNAGAGSGLGLRVDSRSTTSVASVLGAKFDYNASMNWGVMIPHAEIEWQHEFRTDPNAFTAYFINDPTNTPILIRGDKTDSDFFRLGAGMSFVFTQGRSAFLLYDRTVGRTGISQYNLSFGFRLEF
ncbi:MAG: autotransporter domain-containing protein [Proteobacteria bacterium]|nr:autotransporter domain-containing protein [Pseudomonadota bacterium]